MNRATEVTMKIYVSKRSSNRTQSILILFLVWVAGSVDALSYLGLGNVFTANMTGNMVLFGLAIGQGHMAAALRSLFALGGFGLGVAVGAVIVRRNSKTAGWTSAVTVALCLELAVLACLMAAWHFLHLLRHEESILHLLIVLSATAMGIQTATVAHLRLPGIVTTYITGTLATLVTGLVIWSKQGENSSRDTETAVNAGKSSEAESSWNERVILQTLVFLVYGCAAIFSGALYVRWPSFVSLSPLIALVVVLAGVFALRRSGIQAESDLTRRP
jgi:uncharacterized membrane protein YoaK (UPF0700 family)